MQNSLVRTFCFASIVSIGLANEAYGHPSAGIVVDQEGQIYFSDLDRGVLKISADGATTTVLSKDGQHWLALDPMGSFARTEFAQSPHWPRWFKRRTPAGARPAIIGDGGSPIAVGPDGNLFFVCNDEQLIPGGLLLGMLTPDGKETLLNPAFRQQSAELGGIKGLAVGPDGFFYAAYPKAILKFTTKGAETTVLNPVLATDCEEPPAGADGCPALRGLAVVENGVVYVASTGCRSVIKITPPGRVETAMKAESPWSPTGVALARGNYLFWNTT